MTEPKVLTDLTLTDPILTEHRSRAAEVLGQTLVAESLSAHANGRPVRPGGRLLEVSDPASGDVIAHIPTLESYDVPDVVQHAAASFGRHAGQPQLGWLMAAAEAVERNVDTFAAVMTLESGKTEREARGEVGYAVSFLRWFAARASDPAGAHYRLMTTGQDCTVRFVGVGPVLIVTPWNFPLAMITRKVAAAWAAGCPVICKPAEATPLTALLFAQVCREASVPEAAFQVAVADDPGPLVASFLADRRIRKVSFTGSTRVGQIIARAAADHMQRVSLELGGNAAFVVCADADMDVATKAMSVAKFRNAGQTCIAANRFLVHRSRREEFVAALRSTADRQVVGSGFDRLTTLGPLISASQRQRAQELVDEARMAGADVYGKCEELPGSFMSPLVVTNVSPDSGLWQEEIFAPVATVATFDTDEEAISLANDTPYGLANYVMTSSLARRHAYVNQLASGMIGVNTGAISDAGAPFGGVGLSGYGREGGGEGLREYQECRYVAEATACS